MATKRKFEDAWLRSRKDNPPEKIEECADTMAPGLWMRVNPTGKVAFFYRYTSPVDKKRKRVTIGGYPSVTIKQARAKASRFALDLERIEPGMDEPELHSLDPWFSMQRKKAQAAQDKLDREEARKSVETVGDAWTRYKKMRKPHIKAWDKTENIWTTHWERFEETALPELTADDILDHLVKVRDGKDYRPLRPGEPALKPAPYAANRAHDLIKAVLQLSVRHCADSTNPAAFKKIAKTKVRTHSPKPEDAAAVWIAAGQRAKSCKVLRFAILTLKRRAEIALAHSSHIDREKKLWRIPAENSKINIEEFVPLSDAMLEQLPPADYSGPCFPGRDTPEMHPDTVSKYWDVARKAAGLPDFRLHDLRSAGGGYLGLTMSTALISRVLGHKYRTAGATFRYVHLDETDPEVQNEKRHALEKWERAVMAAVATLAT